jgi:hypothetical protein
MQRCHVEARSLVPGDLIYLPPGSFRVTIDTDTSHLTTRIEESTKIPVLVVKSFFDNKNEVTLIKVVINDNSVFINIGKKKVELIRSVQIDSALG